MTAPGRFGRKWSDGGSGKCRSRSLPFLLLFPRPGEPVILSAAGAKDLLLGRHWHHGFPELRGAERPGCEGSSPSRSFARARAARSLRMTAPGHFGRKWGDGGSGKCHGAVVSHSFYFFQERASLSS